MSTASEWTRRRMGDLVTLTSGQSPSGFTFGPTGTPYYKVDQLGRSTKYLRRSSTPYFSQQLPRVPAGSVMIAKRGGAIALNRVRLLTEPSFMDTNVMALTPSSALDSEFLYYWLGYRGLWDIADVTSVPQINNKHINPLEIALPDIDEQRRIAAALRHADELIATLKRQISKKQAIRQGMMQELLTGRTRLPGFSDKWSPARLRDAGSTYGGLSGKVKRDFGIGSARFVTFVEVMAGVRLLGRELGKVNVGPNERQNQVLRGDVLFNGSSETPEEVALAASVEFDPSPRTYLNSFCFGYRLKNQRRVNPTYLAYLFRANEGRALVSSLAQGATRYNISKTKLLELSPVLPPRGEQDAIVGVLGDAEAEIQGLQSRLSKTRDIKQGMMQELLTGRTRLSAPEDAA